MRTNILRFIFESSTTSTDGFHASVATTLGDSKGGTVLILRPLDRSIIVPSLDSCSDPLVDIDNCFSFIFSCSNQWLPLSLVVFVEMQEAFLEDSFRKDSFELVLDEGNKEDGSSKEPRFV